VLAIWAGLGASRIAAAFPWLLFGRLAAVTALFSIALRNGTMERLAWLALKVIRFQANLAGPMFFLAALALASLGAGNFAACSVIAPVAMSVTQRLRISAFLMSVMVVYGATAGAFSPVAPTGIVVAEVTARAGVTYSRWGLFSTSLAAHFFTALVIFLLMRGWRITAGLAQAHDHTGSADCWTDVHRKTAFVLAGFLVLSLAVRWPVEWTALACTAALLVLRIEKRSEWVRGIPWGLILMVCSVSMLAAVVQQAGGMALLGRLLAGSTHPRWLPGELAFVSGLVSVAASSIGVVLPAFLPAIPEIVRAAGGGDPTAIAYSINVGAHLVDISPLSPLGAFCVAYAPEGVDRRVLFQRLMVMGLSMCLLGAVLCQILFGTRVLSLIGP
jgi:di/tricarboxylate transporter